MYSLFAVLTGFLLDCLFGDPNFALHPIRIMGRLIGALENVFRKIFPESNGGELAGGVVLAVSVCCICFFSVFFVLRLLYGFKATVGFICESLLCWLFVAARDLKKESMNVYERLKANDLTGARKAVSMIVGRDTERLDCEGVAKAAIETVAENTSDGVIAPLIYMFIGGAPLGALYKAINTMDSMVGYKNSRYLYFGRAAARLDDAVNFIPSRISAVFMIIASFILGCNYRNAVKIFKRDRLKHKSPNSAQTEAVCAGALGLRLAGDAWYFGELYKKDYIGDALNEVSAEHIVSANRLMYVSAVITIVVFGLIKFVLLGGL
ncbi:MAG: adenosylcobinamide-phosphate synthase CbiB [Clostridia bacterium]|nr:adenosylcobinamide-phosphate synthase CbiB [Clostridia bacterium]